MPTQHLTQRSVIMMGLALLCLAGAVSADDNAFDRLLAAKSLKCQLGEGAVGDWKGGKLTVRKDTFGITVFFDGIDLTQGTARVIANGGAGRVSVHTTAAGVTFIEQTGWGNLVISTVFADYHPKTRQFILVMSRHLSFFSFGSPLPSQYHGTCQVWE
jgi:hypothetical protein